MLPCRVCAVACGAVIITWEAPSRIRNQASPAGAGTSYRFANSFSKPIASSTFSFVTSAVGNKCASDGSGLAPCEPENARSCPESLHEEQAPSINSIATQRSFSADLAIGSMRTPAGISWPKDGHDCIIAPLIAGVNEPLLRMVELTATQFPNIVGPPGV